MASKVQTQRVIQQFMGVQFARLKLLLMLSQSHTYILQTYPVSERQQTNSLLLRLHSRHAKTL